MYVLQNKSKSDGVILPQFTVRMTKYTSRSTVFHTHLLLHVIFMGKPKNQNQRTKLKNQNQRTKPKNQNQRTKPANLQKNLFFFEHWK
jgi:hypothetical protein